MATISSVSPSLERWPIASEVGLTPETLSLETLCNGLFTLSTQFIKTK